MIEIIDFFVTNKKKEKTLFGTVAIVLGKKGEIKIVSGDEKFSAFVEEELMHGVKMPAIDGLFFPKDGENFILAILRRFSGSYFWAERKTG